MRKHGMILSAWLLATMASLAQVQPGTQQPRPAQNPYPTQPMQPQFPQATGQPTGKQPATIQPVVGFQAAQPGTGQPGTGQPGAGQPGTGQPMIPQPVVGPGAVQLPPVQPLNPNDPLDKVLMRWEAEMMKVQTLAAQLERVETDLALKSERALIGYAQYMRVGGPQPMNLAMLEMRPKNNTKELAEKFICSGSFLYEYSVQRQEIRAHRLPQPAPGQPAAADNFLSFLFGMRAQEAKRRYDLKLEKEDQYYYFIQVLPRLPDDKGDFERAQVVLYKDSFMPRMLWFQKNRESTTTWHVPAIKGGVDLKRETFDAPKPPQGWKLTEVPQQPTGQPRVIRGGP